ncbi:MAG: flagellar basal body P-ring formation chaperone FlgA [Stellaceae bacterium]
MDFRARAALFAAALVLAPAAQAAAAPGFTDPAAIRAAVENAVQTAAPQLPATTLEADVAPIDPAVHFPACPALAATAPPLSGSFITVKVSCPAPAWTIYVPVRLHQWRQVVVAAAALPPNRPLTAADLTLARVDTATLPSAPVAEPAEAIGKLLRTNVPAASPILAAQLEAPVLIRRDQKVLVTLNDGAITVKTTLVAEQDGRVGDVISLRNPASQKVIRATVTADGEAEMHL